MGRIRSECHAKAQRAWRMEKDKSGKQEKGSGFGVRENKLTTDHTDRTDGD